MIASFYSIFIDRAMRRLRLAVPKFAGMKPGERVLDVCCGTGDQATYFARLGMDSWGIDLDPKMIAVAVSRKRDFGGDNLNFQEADATALPFQDGAFDYTTISLALHEKPAETQHKVIAEMRRVTRTGGTLILADFRVPVRRLFRFIEAMVGGEHYACFKRYEAGGGLNNLAASLNLDIEDSETVMGRGIHLVKIYNQELQANARSNG